MNPRRGAPAGSAAGGFKVVFTVGRRLGQRVERGLETPRSRNQHFYPGRGDSCARRGCTRRNAARRRREVVAVHAVMTT